MNNSKKFVAVSSDNRNLFKNFIESLDRSSDNTNHSLAFEYAFKLIRSNLDMETTVFDENSIPPVLILYVSRGIITDISEIKNVLEVIATGQSRLKQPIIINTCAIILGNYSIIIIRISNVFHLFNYFLQMKRLLRMKKNFY